MKKGLLLGLVAVSLIAGFLASRAIAGAGTMSDIWAIGTYGLNELRIDRYGGIQQTDNSSATNALVDTAVTGTLSASGVTTLTGGANLSGYIGIYARTSAQIKATTPTVVGQMAFDTTLMKPVFASGTATSFDWVLSSGGRATNY
jgi:hypothetical protein